MGIGIGIARNGVSHSCYPNPGAIVNGGLGGLSVKHGIADRAQCEQAHVGITTGVGEKGHHGAE